MKFRNLIPMYDIDGAGGGGFPEDIPAEDIEIIEQIEQETEQQEEQPQEETEEQPQEETEQEQEQYYKSQEEVDAVIQKRLARERRNFEKELKKYEKLSNYLKQYGGIEGETLDEQLQTLKNFYKEQGIEIQDDNNGLEEEDALLLADVKAQKIMEEYDQTELERELERLSKKPENKRTTLEKALYNKLYEHKKGVEDLKHFKKLYPKVEVQELIQDDKFTHFLAITDKSLSFAEKYEAFLRFTGKAGVKPPTTPNIKGQSANKPTNKYYTAEELASMSKEEMKRNMDKVLASYERLEKER